MTAMCYCIYYEVIKLKRLTTRLEEEVHTDLKIICAINNISIQEYMGNFIKDSIKKRENIKLLLI